MMGRNHLCWKVVTEYSLVVLRSMTVPRVWSQGKWDSVKSTVSLSCLGRSVEYALGFGEGAES